MSRTAFTKRFTVLVGKPPMTYLTGWRLTSGARLLRATNAPLTAIARRSATRQNSRSEPLSAASTVMRPVVSATSSFAGLVEHRAALPAVGSGRSATNGLHVYGISAHTVLLSTPLRKAQL
jgi:hypothetical protein